MRRRLKADGTPESVPLYPYEIITRPSALGQLDYSAFPVPDTTLDDFSPEELKHLRDILTRNRNSDQALLELPDGEILSALRMTTLADGKVTPTVTGILLAGRAEVIARAIPASAATFQVLAGTEVRVNQDFEQPLLYTIEKMREMLDPWNPEREFEDGLFRQSMPEFADAHGRANGPPVNHVHPPEPVLVPAVIEVPTRAHPVIPAVRIWGSMPSRGRTNPSPRRNSFMCSDTQFSSMVFKLMRRPPHRE